MFFSILERDDDVGGIRCHRGVDSRRDVSAHGRDRGITRAGIGELFDANLAENERRGGAMMHRQLRFESGARYRVAHQFHDERVHAQLDALDRIRGDAVRAAQF